MTKYEKPLPLPTLETQPFWDYCQKHELRMQKCTQCAHIRYYGSIVCPKCGSMEDEWVKLSGRVKVFSFVIFQQAYSKAWANDVPYAVVLVELEEGPRVVARIEQVDTSKPEEIKVGVPLTVKFLHRGEGEGKKTFLAFKPLR